MLAFQAVRKERIMVNGINLSEFDREFFELAAEAMFLNPFSPRHSEVLRKLAGIVGKQGLAEPKAVLALVMERVAVILRQIERHGVWPAPLKYIYFDDTSRPLMRYIILFRELYRYRDDFDELVSKQAKRPDKNLSVSFVGSIIYGMGARGFDKADAIRWVAIFYQMRRAHYFLVQGFIGQSDCMRQLREDLWNTLFTQDVRIYDTHYFGRMEDYSILLEGPTGCGKGAAAGIIGKSCIIPYQDDKSMFESNFMELFLSANLSQSRPGLVESELFGHTAGAFTGAVSAYGGLFEKCRPCGTVFLDEIGGLDEQVQVKLLKVLDERTYTPVGSATPKRFSGRVIAATNRPPADLRKHGVLREDLYYRLCADCIVVPSLALRVQQNPGELEELVEHFTRLETNDYHPKLAGRVMDVIATRLGKDYAWPGNVRELVQCIRRVTLKGDYRPDERLAGTKLDAIAAGIEKANFTAEQLTTEYCKFLFGRYGSYKDAARITGLDWKTVKGRVG
jgi:hypothetical protein